MLVREQLQKSENEAGRSMGKEGRFSSHAAFLNNKKIVCGGSLVAPNVVLFGSGCMELNLPDEVALGCANVRDLSKCEVIAIREMKSLDPELNPGDNSLAFLERDSKQIPLAIASPGFEIDAGLALTVIGWEAGDALDTTVKSISQDSCAPQYSAINDLLLKSSLSSDGAISGDGVVFDDSRICITGGVDYSCSAREGSHLILRCDSNESDLLVGVAADDNGCDYNNNPGIFSKVSDPRLFNFIRSEVEKEGHQLKTLESPDFCLSKERQSAGLVPSLTPTSAPTTVSAESRFQPNDGFIVVLAVVAVILGCIGGKWYRDSIAETKSLSEQNLQAPKEQVNEDAMENCL